MQRKCLKCDHVNPNASGEALEACPSCGAIYSRVEAALAARPAPSKPPPTVPDNAVFPPPSAAVRKETPAPSEDRTGGNLIGTVLIILVAGVIWGSLRFWFTAKPSAADQVRHNIEQETAIQARAERVKAAVAEGRVFVGMTADEAAESWGRPHAVNSTLSASGKSEQWVYYRGQAKAQYVYLSNGVVTTIQSSE